MVERRPPKPEVEGSSPSSPADYMKFIRTYFSDVKIELKKVSWLSKNEMLGSTLVVCVFSIIVAIFLFVVDFGVSQFIARLIGG